MRRPTAPEQLYIDFDGFFAACEEQADRQLQGRPLGVIPFAVADHITCSIGYVPNRWLAKIAADLDKPDGLTVLVLGLGPQQERLRSLQEQCRIAFLHCDMVNTYIQCSWRLRNMATSIRLDPETEHRLDVLATQTGRTKAFYLREIIERGLEDLEDYYLAADVLERFRHGTENVYSSADVRHALHLDD